MYYVLCIILAVSCAAVGILGLGLIGYELLGFVGLRPHPRRRLQLAGLLFALPAGIVGAYIGYGLGGELGL